MIISVSVDTAAPALRGSVLWKLIAALVAALMLFGLGFAVGTQRSTQVKELSGTAHVGDRWASVMVNGWAYGIVDSVPWIDAEGSLHEAGWPACLGSERDAFIKFAAVGVHYPDKTYERHIVYVDCRS